MLNFSVNTNAGAMIALQNLSSTNQQLSVAQSRINTGLKVSSTKDDSATYVIAQNLRSDIGGLNAVKGSLDRAKSTLDVAITAAESMSEILNLMKEKAVAASDSGVDDDSRAAMHKDFTKLIDQLNSTLKSAEFNSSNILTGTATIAALLDANGTQTLDVANQGLDEAGGALVEFISAGTPATVTWATAANAGDWAVNVEEAMDAMSTVLSTLGSASRQIDAQLSFTAKLTDTIQTGIGNLVDADLAKESATLQSLQTKQQLGLQALSIANQAPQSIMSLFRN